jgi:DNA-binding MarR family transcriptional regulator
MSSLAAAPVPSKLEDVGVRSTLLNDLALKILYLIGGASLRELSDRLRLSYGIVEQIFQRLRKDQLVEATGMTAGIHTIAVTAQGRSRATELLAQNQYSGPAPVSFEDYVRCVEAQSPLC